jgi:hypothetical protein
MVSLSKNFPFPALSAAASKCIKTAGIKMQGLFDEAVCAQPGQWWRPPAMSGRWISWWEAVFHAEAFALDDDGLGVMQQAIEDGGG